MSASLAGTVTSQALDFWRWWISELRDFLPKGFTWAKGGSKTRIHLLRDRVILEREASGVDERYESEGSLDTLDDDSWQQLEALIFGTGAEIVLAHPDVFHTATRLPRAARGRLRTAVGLQLHEFSPLDPMLIVWTINGVRRDAQWIHVGVTTAKRQRVLELQQLFDARGLPAPPITSQVEKRSVLIAPGFRGGQQTLTALAARKWLLVMALLLAGPLLTLTAAKWLTAQNERASAGLETVVGPKLEIERRAREVERVRRALQPLFRQASASLIVEDLARRLPDSAHAVELSMSDEGELRLIAETPDPDSLRPLLARDRLLRGIQEVAQAKTDTGNLRVTYERAR